MICWINLIQFRNMNVASLAWLFLWILACSARQIPRKEHHLLHQNDHHEKRAQDTQVSSGSDKSDEEEYPVNDLKANFVSSNNNFSLVLIGRFCPNEQPCYWTE